MKHKIEKNTVQETLIIPLYARKVCSELYPNLYRDETAVRLIDEIDYDRLSHRHGLLGLCPCYVYEHGADLQFYL